MIEAPRILALLYTSGYTMCALPSLDALSLSVWGLTEYGLCTNRFVIVLAIFPLGQ